MGPKYYYEIKVFQGDKELSYKLGLPVVGDKQQYGYIQCIMHLMTSGFIDTIKFYPLTGEEQGKEYIFKSAVEYDNFVRKKRDSVYWDCLLS